MDSIIEWLQSILNAIVCVGEKVLCVAKVFLKFLMDLVLWGPRMLYAEISDYLGAFIQSMHIGEAWASIMTGLVGLQPYIGYWWDLFEITALLTATTSALALRFILRHLPVIGG